MNTHSHNSKRFLISYTTSQNINLAWKESSLKDWSAKSPCSWAWLWIKESSQEDYWFCISIYIHTYMHCIALHCIALHCIALHYITYIHTYHINSHVYIYIYIHAYMTYIPKKHYMQRKVCRANQRKVNYDSLDICFLSGKHHMGIEGSSDSACCGNNNGLKLRTLPRQW